MSSIFKQNGPKRRRKSLQALMARDLSKPVSVWNLKHVSRATLNNPAGSTDPLKRDARKARREKTMRLRKLRGRSGRGAS